MQLLIAERVDSGLLLPFHDADQSPNIVPIRSLSESERLQQVFEYTGYVGSVGIPSTPTADSEKMIHSVDSVHSI